MDRASTHQRSGPSPPRVASAPVIVAALGVLVVAVQWINARPLWLDEEMIAINLRDRSFADLAGQLWLDQSAPLGWLVLQRLVLLTLGSSELALRLVPALFGVATVLAACSLGRRWLTTAGSVVFVLLCSFGQWISFYAIELKSYSADTFFGVLLPGLAVATAGSASSDVRRKGIAVFLATAAVGHWFSLGALFVLPACLTVIAMSMRRQRDAVRPLAPAAAVLAVSIGAHYLLGIRHTQANETLRQFWQFALPPAGAGVSGTAAWLVAQLEPFAMKPGGTALATAFWTAAAVGVAAATTPRLGVTAGLVVASGFALAALGMMPLYERLSLWFVPAIYLAIALAADRAVWFLRTRPLKQSWMNLAGAGAIAALVVPVCGDLLERGVRDLRAGRPRETNRDTDDRSAVRWLMEQRQPGDLLITTHHALPAIWWYGGVALSDAGGRQFADGGRIVTAEYHKSPRVCHGRELEKLLDGRSRVQVYLGFVDMPPGFDDLLLERLTKYGAITSLRHFAGASRAAIVDPRYSEGSNLFWDDAGKDTGTWLKGCVAAGRGRAW